MTPREFVLRSVLHYRISYLGVLAGAALGATVLLGALFAGDSVEESLRQISARRTGRATHVLTAGDRFFREALATDLARGTKARVTPVIYSRGIASHASGATVNQAQLIGVTEEFWSMAPTPKAVPLDVATSGVAVNDTLARRLNLAVGDALIVRLQKPGVLAGSAPIAGAESKVQSLRCAVRAIVDDATFGRFSLETTQVAPSSVFLPIKLLQDALGQTAGANLLLIDATDPAADFSRSLAGVLQLADYGLALKWLERAGIFELSSRRIFIDPELAAAVASAVPRAQPVVSYLVNEFRAGDRSTPYSVASATTAEAAPFLPADLGPRDIILNDWLAEDLAAQVGSEVAMKYYQSGAAGSLVEQGATFRVRAIVPLQGLAADPAWMPEFPGISDAKRQGDWDSGLPLDLDRIRDKDERYWDNHRGAPKAFLSLAAGRELWSTPWGNTTGFRVAFDRARETELAQTILGALRPEMNELQLRSFQANAQAAAKSSVDFGGLFVGMSFFLIAAALGLVAMLFQLSLLQRNREDALLGAVGLSARQLLRWRLAECLVILLIGCVAGVALGTLYTRQILRFLETIWAAQSAGSTFVFTARPASVAIGCTAFLLLSLLGVWFAIRRQTRRALSVRLAAHAEESGATPRVRRTSIVIFVFAGIIAVGAIALSGRAMPAQGAFYLAGFALLAAGIAFCRWWIARVVTPAAPKLDARHLGGLNVKARRSRSLTVVGLIATAVFMVLSVASFRKHVGADWLQRASGTGGFTFLIETTAPLNLTRANQAQSFAIFEPHARELGEIIALRAGAGDNANCFNLNTTAQPRLAAVDAAKLAARSAFMPRLPSDVPATAGWNALALPGPQGALRAFVDETTLMWALKRKVGDVLTYTDENGARFEVQIAGTLRDSIFQGYLIVDEKAFLQRYPSHPGYSLFLADARDPAQAGALRGRLETSSRDAGGRVELTRDVLAAFHQIENTYIGIFNVLGSLGVILGSLGLAIVIARNLRERRGEFIVMTAIGIPRRVLARMVFSEFGRLIAWGIAIGAIASALAVWPNIGALPPGPTLLLVAGLLAGVVTLNLVCGWAVFRWSTRDLRPGMEQAAA